MTSSSDGTRQGGIEDLDARRRGRAPAFDEGPWPQDAGRRACPHPQPRRRGIRAVADDLAYVEALESGKPIRQATR